MHLEEFDRQAFEQELPINLTAPFELARKLAPLMRAGAALGDPSRIINIAPVEGMRPPAWESFLYAASEAELIMMTRHLAA